MSRSRDKGTAAERAVVGFLRDAGFPNVERRALNGSRDRGDVAGLPLTVIEVKNEKSVALAEYVDEANVEAHNDGARWGVAWFKRRGRANPGQWFVLMDGHTFVRLLHDALDTRQENAA